MAKSLNKVTLIGNLGVDPEFRTLENSNTVTNLSIATHESWTDSNGEKQERTEWHRVAAWGKLAEICNEYLRKGSKVYVEGRLQTRKWEKDGVERYSTEIALRDILFLDSRNSGSSNGTSSQSRPEPAYAGDNVGVTATNDDDLPF